MDILWSSDIATTIHTANRGPRIVLEEGYNIINVDFTAENGDVKIYIIKITKSETSTPSGGVVNSPGSVLHGRTRQVADAILNADSSIARYNQVTNVAQLSSITSLSLDDYYITSLQNNNFYGLTNLRNLDLSNNGLTTLPARVFDNLIGLDLLEIHGNFFAPTSVLEYLNSIRDSSGILAAIISLDSANLDIAEGGMAITRPSSESWPIVKCTKERFLLNTSR